MMGRGAEGGCGTEERACPVSRAPSSSSLPRPRAAVDLLSQARKALSGSSTLPDSLASSVSRHGGDGRRKSHQKKPPHPPSKSKTAPPVSTLWDKTEDHFRALALNDLDLLVSPANNEDDPCLRISRLQPAPAGGEDADELYQVEDMEIDDDDNCEGVEPENSLSVEGTVSASPSLNWLLGSKLRVVLTTERPGKKRRLLGSEAGLERLLRLPHAEDGSPSCDYCCNQGVSAGDLLHCKHCHAAVHCKCYGVSGDPEVGTWLCSWCRYLEECGDKRTGVSDSSEKHPCCWLCPRDGGALKPIDEGRRDGDGIGVRFVHLFCCLWMPELYVENIEAMEPIANVEEIPDARRKLVCNLCKVKHGACVRCSHGACRASFHPSCAREAKHKMEIWGKVGCDNVELRAFCARHSAIQEDPCHPNTRSITSCAHSNVDDSLSERSPADKLVQDKVSSVTKDGSPQQNDDAICMTRFSGNEEHLDNNVVGVDSKNESCKTWQDENAGTVGPVNDNRLSLPKLLLILKKLIEKGKVNINDVASETGILLDTLKSVIQGDSSILPSEMQLKLIKWLQNSVYIGSSSRHLKLSNDAAFFGAKEAHNKGDNNITDALEDLEAVIATEVDTSDVIAKSPSPQKRTNGNIGILKHTEVATSSTDIVVQEFNRKICSETVDVLQTDNKCVEVPAFQSSIEQDCSKEKQVPGLPIGGDFSCARASFEEHQKDKESIESDVCLQGSGSYPPDDLNKKLVTKESTDPIGPICTVPNHQVSNSMVSFVHPWIQKRLIEMDFDRTKRIPLEDHSLGHRKTESFLGGSASTSNEDNLSRHSNELIFEKSNNELTGELKILEVLDRAREAGITDLSPEDELEGEILRLQSKLLSVTVSLKSQYDNLLFKVVGAIPTELEASRKQRWDTVLVNRYLREVREAKKRGRKERRNREAQAILAAATDVVASSRVLSLRKDGKDEIKGIRDERKLDVKVACTDPESYALERRKEKPLKLDSKLSSGKQPDVFAISCDVCGRPEILMKPIFVCGRCKVAVHLACYCRSKDPISSWYCEPCQLLNSYGHEISSSDCREKSSFVPQCCFCGTTTGAFRMSTDGKWVHAFCAEWVLGSKFRRGQEHPVEGVDILLTTREALNCCICHQNIGVCIKCSYGHCQTAFHPFCARDAGWFMNVKTIVGNPQHKAYCGKHSHEQREKAEFQHGAEEFKNLRQTRVELEKLRLLCERIVRREKIKRELLVCSFEVLAGRRTYVAKTFARTSFLSSGYSSESATTSINNTSYSETVDRSDDVTVDSTISKMSRSVPSLHIRLDRTGEASMGPNRSSTRVASDRATFSGKQLPQRPVSLDKASNDGKKPSKTGKHKQTPRKELHALVNQQSSQDVVHEPVESTSKSQDEGSREPPQPDG